MPLPDQGGAQPAAADRHPRRRVLDPRDLGADPRSHAHDRARGAADRLLAGGDHGAGPTSPRPSARPPPTAGAIAGLTVVRVLNEPTAAALAYGHQRRLNQTIAVYDFGGGTFDVTILRLSDQVFEVLGTAGDSFLGGDDIDERVVDQLVDAFLTEHRVDLRDNEVAMMRLRAVAEQTKIELSRRQKALIRIDELAYGPGGAPIHLQCELSRAELVARVTDVIDRTFPVCEEALKMAGLPTTKIDDVVLVGGTTRMPAVRDRVSEFFRPPAAHRRAPRGGGGARRGPAGAVARAGAVGAAGDRAAGARPVDAGGRQRRAADPHPSRRGALDRAARRDRAAAVGWSAAGGRARVDGRRRRRPVRAAARAQRRRHRPHHATGRHAAGDRAAAEPEPSAEHPHAPRPGHGPRWRRHLAVAAADHLAAGARPRRGAGGGDQPDPRAPALRGRCAAPDHPPGHRAAGCDGRADDATPAPGRAGDRRRHPAWPGPGHRRRLLRGADPAQRPGSPARPSAASAPRSTCSAACGS
jgi:hypothetical protein